MRRSEVHHASEFVRLKVDVIVTVGSAAVAVKQVTSVGHSHRLRCRARSVWHRARQEPFPAGRQYYRRIESICRSCGQTPRNLASAVSRASQALILANAGNPPQCGAARKPLSLDTRALPVSISCGDPKFPPNLHAGAIPPGSLSVPAQEHFGFLAIRVALVGECVFARC
jgi:hypothetical protein